jgi:methyl-accepting chemotaxis protein
MIAIYCVVIAVIAVSVYIYSVARRRELRAEAVWAAKWVQQLRRLLELFPKHRGMANALLKGDDSFHQPLQNLQREVDRQMEMMRGLIKESHAQGAQDLLRPIEQQWQAIRDGVFTLQAGRSFVLHTRLIAQVIERMEDDSLVLQREVQNDKSLGSLLNVLTHDLPHIVESIGQARGIGTGVAAQRASSVANRVNLKFLHGKTASIIDGHLSLLRSSAKRYQEMGLNFYDEIDQAVSSAQTFTAVIHSELIEKTTPTIAPDEFYRQGTAAIDAGFQLFDKLYPRWLDVRGIT